MGTKILAYFYYPILDFMIVFGTIYLTVLIFVVVSILASFETVDTANICTSFEA
jgi:hypothetical protein